MPKFVLNYFNLKGLGESIRMLLAYGGQEFEDRRITQEEWVDIKPTTPFGTLPVLEIDGKQYAQSWPISRYLGRKYGLAGADAEEDFIIDQNLEFFNDIRMKAAMVFFEKDPEANTRKHEENCKEVYPTMLKRLNQMITENNGHIALGRLTWADFVFAGGYDSFKYILKMPDLDKEYPAFKKLQEKVCSLPKVKEYIATIPPSDVSH